MTGPPLEFARWRLSRYVNSRAFSRPARSTVSIASGDHRARVLARRDDLITAHLHLVRPIARRIRKLTPSTFELDDLISEGTLGLIRAATLYLPEAHGGCPFSAFARPRIRGAILDSIRRRHFIENTGESLDGPGHMRQPSGVTDAFMPNGKIDADCDDRESSLGARLIDIRPLPCDEIDESIRLKCLTAALQLLPRDQRRVLERWYGDTGPATYKRAGWRRRRRVIALREAGLANLKLEYRRAA
jgi:RNA polymerase sigma factor (sigma-70 family)